LAALGVLPIAFFLGSHWGTGGIAWAWVIAYPLVVVPLYRKTFQSIEMDSAEYLRALRPALDGVLVMSVFVLGVKRLWHPARLLPMLSAEIAVGTLAYSAALLLFHRKRVFAFTGFLKEFVWNRR